MASGVRAPERFHIPGITKGCISSMADPKEFTPAASSDQAADRRRSMRVHLAMPIIVRGTAGTSAFQEQTQTVIVSAHGCMLRLRAKVRRGQEVSIVNPRTAEELTCTVISLAETEPGKMEVGLQFTEPSPLFWRIAFPPEDWDPSERKLPSYQPPRNRPRR